MSQETKTPTKKRSTSSKPKVSTPAAAVETVSPQTPEAKVPAPVAKAKVDPTPVAKAKVAPTHNHDDLEARVASLEATLHALKSWIGEHAQYGTGPARNNRRAKLKDL